MRYHVREAEHGFQVIDTRTGRPIAQAALNYEVPERFHAEQYAASLNRAIARWLTIRETEQPRTKGEGAKMRRAA